MRAYAPRQPSAEPRSTFTRARVVTLSAAAAGGGALLPPGSSLRLLLILWFVTLSPGLALTPLLALPDLLEEVVIAVALSLSLATLLSLGLLYARLWSPGAAFAGLIGVCLAGLALQRRKGLA